MIPTQKEILLIKNKFSEMQSTQDFVDLLNYVKPFVYGEKAIPFKLRQITYYCNPKRTISDWAFFNQYVDFEIPKKSGGTRKIHAPKKGLKSVQRTLAFIFQCVFDPHKAAMGFTKNKSIVDNARLHVNSHYVYNIDLKDFFPSIDQARVWKCLQLAPFNLNKENSKEFQVLTWDDFKVKYPKEAIVLFVKYGDWFEFPGSLKKSREIEKLGSMRENFGVDFQLGYNPANFRRFQNKIDKNIYVIVKLTDGTSTTISCSQAVSELLASGDITLSHLLDFPMLVNEYTNQETGELVRRPIITIPTDGNSRTQILNTKDSKKLSNENKPEEIVSNSLEGLISVIKNKPKPKANYVVFDEEAKHFKVTQYIPKPARLGIANMLAAICCTEMEVERIDATGEIIQIKKNVLPQGAPTSPILTNIICQRLDYLLTGLAKRFGLLYSRYADDITFSSMHNVYQDGSEFEMELHRIIKDQGFRINEKKTRLQKDGFRKEVTGLLVHGQVNVRQKYIKDLRMWLNYWERYGYEKANKIFKTPASENASISKIIIKFCKTPELKKVLEGKLHYLRMVKGSDNEVYKNLKAKFEKLTGKVVFSSKHLNDVEEAETSNKPLVKQLLGYKEKPIVISEEKIIDVSTDEQPIPLFHKPKELITLLKNFSVNDSALKYTTHSWDAGRDAKMFNDLNEFLSIAKSQYNEFSYALKGLSENLNGKIYNFLFNSEIAKSGWGDINPKKRIYFGWSSPELLEACKNDISLNPEDFILPEKYQIQRSGKTLQKFKHIIDVFKNEIEVRDENSALLSLILQKHDHYLISFSAPKVSNLENKTFYTDIQWLGKALDLIFEGIQKYPQHPDVEYTVTESNNDRLILTILHHNSYKNGLSIHDDKLNLKRGDFSTIKDKLKNLCDWSIESEFAEGAYRINYLTSDNAIPAHEKIKSAEGFKHILTFYK